AGQTYGIYIAVTNMDVANSLRYTSSASSPAEGAVSASDLNMELITGTVIFGPFTSTVGAPVNRLWNGNVKYSVGCETARTPVLAKVSPSPAIIIATTATAVCTGGSADLTVSSPANDPDYEY